MEQQRHLIQKKNSLHDNSLSAEIRRFYVDFEYYIPRMKPTQREI